ncbi:MAG: phosphatidylglycerol lysyltransferase domain-containing protein [Nanoarchaeota archaeon]
MERVSTKKAVELSRFLDKFSYFANPFYLAANCWWENRNGEDLVFEKDAGSGAMILMIIPKKRENMVGQRISVAYDSDIEAIERAGLKVAEKKEIGVEYIYLTDEFVTMAGGRFKTFRKEVHNFQKKYPIKVLEDYPKQKIVEFMRDWHAKKDISGKSDLTKAVFDADFQNCLDYLEMLPIISHKKVFIELDGRLVGFQVMVPMRDDLWIALMQKTDISLRGLTKLLYHLPAVEMAGVKYFTTGAEAQDPKLAEFKESIHPVMKLPIYYIQIDDL